ncbi:unnamed protein product [Nippostrongylus brasiliensis]|uniref:N-terminal Ras-GEF domain-containing protein n=1 Tax=Nippostrongylus brasiliensis TaxID=27835 RepID=A0A0N4YQQ5_NIPBR|nr:unnamed protein product [Nippostrongylus brasiliensis]
MSVARSHAENIEDKPNTSRDLWDVTPPPSPPTTMAIIPFLEECLRAFARFCERVDDDGDVVDDEFLFSLFIAHQWLVDSTQLLAQFIVALQESTAQRCRDRLCLAVVYWIRRFPHHFDGQPQLRQVADRFRTSVVMVFEAPCCALLHGAGLRDY